MALRVPDHLCVEPGADGKGGDVLSGSGRADGSEPGNVDRPRAHGVGDALRSVARLRGEAEEAAENVGGPGGDDSESGACAGQAVRNLVDDPIASHRHHDVVAGGGRVRCGGPCLRGAAGPDRGDVVRTGEDGDHLAMEPGTESGGRRVGDQNEATHHVERSHRPGTARSVRWSS